MSELLTIETERVDDVPLLLAQLDRMQVAELINQHFPAHPNWQGLSPGKMCVGWPIFFPKPITALITSSPGLNDI